MLNAIRIRRHKRYLEEALRRQAYPSQPIGLAQAHVIGLLFDATHLERRRAALAFADELQQMGKLVFKLGYFDSQQSDPNFTFKHFNKSQVDWAYRPQSRDVDDFTARTFDILINLEPQTQPLFEYLAVLCRAKFKVGPRASRLEIYDLMVEAAPEEDHAAFVLQVKALLAQTNQHHEESEI